VRWVLSARSSCLRDLQELSATRFASTIAVVTTSEMTCFFHTGLSFPSDALGRLY
jgi:hypothetical protein